MDMQDFRLEICAIQLQCKVREKLFFLFLVVVVFLANDIVMQLRFTL